MTFWHEPGMEPKRAYRWIMQFGLPSGLNNYLIKKVSPRPSWSLTETKHNFLNHTFYYPGRVEYDEISVTVVDAVAPDSIGTLMALLYASGYHVPDRLAAGDYGTISKAGWSGRADGANLNDVTITQLDHDGGKLDTFHLVNTWIKACKFGDLDYESDDILNVELTLRYDYFKMANTSGLRQQYEAIADTAGALADVFSNDGSS